jgi:hypothetical protein
VFKKRAVASLAAATTISEMAIHKVWIVRVGELDEIGMLCPNLRIIRGARWEC